MKTAPLGAVPDLLLGRRDLCPSLDASLIYEKGWSLSGAASLST